MWYSLLFLIVFTEMGLAGFTDQASLTRQAAESMQRGNFRGGASIAEQGVRDFPKSVELWNLLGIARTELRDPQGAAAAFKRGLALAPESVSLYENLGLLYFRQGNYQQASVALSSAVARGSVQPGVLFSLAASKLRIGERASALADLRRLEQPLATNADYWIERGRAESAEQPDVAEKSFSRALELDSGNANALNALAALAERSGDDEKALALLIRARTAHPDDVATLAHFGTVCIRRDLGPDAIDALTRAHQLEPADDSVLYLLARANISVQNWQKAHDLFELFAHRTPGYAPAWHALGWLDIKLDQRPAARRELEHSLRLNIRSRAVRYELAKLDLDDGQLEKAESELQELLHVAPSDANANLAMGDLAMRKGELDRAERHLRQSIQTDPQLAPAHYKLSQLLYRKHDTSEAQKERSIAQTLTAETRKNTKTQLRLVLPEVLTETGPDAVQNR